VGVTKTAWIGTAVLVGALAPAVVPATAHAPHHHRSRLHRDPVGDAGTAPDLRAAGLRQDGSHLVLTVLLRHRLRPAELEPRGAQTLCLDFGRTPRSATRACVHASPKGVLRLREVRYGRGGVPKGARHPAAHFGRPTPHSLRVRFSLRGSGVRPGRFGWSVSTGVVGDCAGTCTDRLPDHGTVGARLRSILPTGCRARTGFYTHGPTHGRRIALTFDDGPWPDTPGFLRVLERKHAPGTFFQIGEQVPGHRALLRRMLRDGDVLANHTYTHADVSGGGAAARRQIQRTQHAIRHASGFTPCLLRPPYGATSHRLVSTAGRLGLGVIYWSADPSDYLRPGSSVIEHRLLAMAHPGGILLMHDGGGDRSQTLAQLPHLIHALRRRGYHLVTVPELLGFRLTYR
jgi:peptidoglycan/xylan/chitin deacetylase (PgdA/CDA1 family)